MKKTENKKAVTRTMSTKAKHEIYYLTPERYNNYLNQKQKARETYKRILNIKENCIFDYTQDMGEKNADKHAEQLLNLNKI